MTCSSIKFGPYEKQERRRYLQVFGIAVLTTVLFFLPFVIADKGIFFYFGDYNVQQIPFYRLAHEAVRSGNWGWNWNTDLGVNFIGSYSFYLLGSPFFWLTIPFPTAAVPYLMMPLFALKFGVAAVTGYAFIRRFTKTSDYAVLGGLMYAFSGFMIYNIFFNHFHDVVALFPLLLIALEESVMNNRRGVFALSVALMAMVNYFFFAGQVMFTLIYFFLRCLMPDFRINLRKFLGLALEAVLGVGIAAALLLPSAMAIMDNPRVDSMLMGYNMLFYGSVQRYGLIAQSFFFPADIAARPNFFPDSNAKWGSVAAYLPMFSMAGVIAFLKEKKKHWVKYLIITGFVMALVPFLNSAFFAFNSAYYARWFYMLTLIMALATVLVLEERSKSIMKGLQYTFFITLGFSVIGILPSKKTIDGVEQTVYGKLPPYPDRFWINVGIAMAGLLATYVLIRLYRKKPKVFVRFSALCICALTIVYGMTSIAFGKQSSYKYEDLVDRGLNAEFQLDDMTNDFYRIDVYKGMDNWPMYWNLPSIQAFHSIVPGSVMEFYPSIGVDRGVGSRPEAKYTGLRSLTSVKYQFISADKQTKEVIPGFELDSTQNGFEIYKNTNYIPMGFTYDYYITEKTFEDYTKDTRNMLLLKGVLLDDEQIRKYSSILSELPNAADEASGVTGMYDVSSSALKQDCDNRRRESGSSFTTDNKGFTSKITLSRENLVFYSVPYDQGWSATVNGKPAEIEKVSHGFMAVKAGAGENTIRFEYETPGLHWGIIVTFISLLLLLAYVLVMRALSKKRPETFAVTPHSHLPEEAFCPGGDITEASLLMRQDPEGAPAELETQTGSFAADSAETDGEKEENIPPEYRPASDSDISEGSEE